MTLGLPVLIGLFPFFSRLGSASRSMTHSRSHNIFNRFFASPLFLLLLPYAPFLLARWSLLLVAPSTNTWKISHYLFGRTWVYRNSLLTCFIIDVYRFFSIVWKTASAHGTSSLQFSVYTTTILRKTTTHLFCSSLTYFAHGMSNDFSLIKICSSANAPLATDAQRAAVSRPRRICDTLNDNKYFSLSIAEIWLQFSTFVSLLPFLFFVFLRFRTIGSSVSLNEL